jgi:hypothetical protein
LANAITPLSGTGINLGSSSGALFPNDANWASGYSSAAWYIRLNFTTGFNYNIPVGTGQRFGAHMPKEPRFILTSTCSPNGKRRQNAALKAKTSMIYVPASVRLPNLMTDRKPVYRVGSTYTRGRNELSIDQGVDPTGEKHAWNVEPGRRSGLISSLTCCIGVRT